MSGNIFGLVVCVLVIIGVFMSLLVGDLIKGLSKTLHFYRAHIDNDDIVCIRSTVFTIALACLFIGGSLMFMVLGFYTNGIIK